MKVLRTHNYESRSKIEDIASPIVWNVKNRTMKDNKY